MVWGERPGAASATATGALDEEAGWLDFWTVDDDERRAVTASPRTSAGAVRVIGRPRLYKAHALMLGCDAAGVAERRLMKRHAPEFFRQLKRGEGDALQQWHCEGEEILEVRPYSGPA